VVGRLPSSPVRIWSQGYFKLIGEGRSRTVRKEADDDRPTAGDMSGGMIDGYIEELEKIKKRHFAIAIRSFESVVFPLTMEGESSLLLS